MIWGELQISVQKRLAAGFVAAAFRLYGNKDSVDFPERLRVVEFQHPAFLCNVILIENSQIERLLPVRTTPPPRLKGARVPGAGLFVQVIGIENE